MTKFLKETIYNCYTGNYIFLNLFQIFCFSPFIFFLLVQKENEPKEKRQPCLFDDPLTARSLSQPRPVIGLWPPNRLRLAFYGIFAEWVPAEKPKAILKPLPFCLPFKG
jgi:hypothetical protein